MSKLSSTQSIKELLRDNELTIKKHYGQNFIIDQNILNKIVQSAAINLHTAVIEIGPGLGALTNVLLRQAGHVLAYEIDRDLIPKLNKEFGENERFTLLHQDIMEADVEKDIRTYLGTFDEVVVVANLPYYITTPILMRFLEEDTKVDRLIVMMQYEVAMRFTSKPSTKDYNALSIIVQYLSDTSYLFKVPSTVFIPRPNVDSAMISIQIKKNRALTIAQEKVFFRFLHDCFGQRRKTLVNNLLSTQKKIERSQIDSYLQSHNYSLTIRSEELSLSNFLDLFLHFEALL